MAIVFRKEVDQKVLADKLLEHVINNFGFEDTVGWLLDEGYTVADIRMIFPEITDEDLIYILEAERLKAIGLL